MGQEKESSDFQRVNKELILKGKKLLMENTGYQRVHKVQGLKSKK